MSENTTDSVFSAAKVPTIFDVAARANVSIKTVSKVMNDHPDVSGLTRARVQAAIAELAYRPTRRRARPSAQRSSLLGLFCDEPAVSSQYIIRIQLAMLAICQSAGYHLVIECVHASNRNVAEQVQGLVAQSKLAGVVLTPPLSDLPELIASLDDTDTPIVRFSPATSSTRMIDVDIDNRQAAYDMTRYLTSLGHTRIGFVRGPAHHADAKSRFEGYRKALSDAAIPYEEEICPAGNYGFASGVRCGMKLLALARRPTAIFASNDDMAHGVMTAALRYSLRIPRDLSVAGFDDALLADRATPRLTTCHQPVGDMVEAAVSALIERGGPKFGSIVLPHRLIVGDSTAPPANASVS